LDEVVRQLPVGHPPSHQRCQSWPVLSGDDIEIELVERIVERIHARDRVIPSR
jgi:hypothetical protein